MCSNIKIKIDLKIKINKSMNSILIYFLSNDIYQTNFFDIFPLNLLYLMDFPIFFFNFSDMRTLIVVLDLD